jgi:hypothetical protein
MQYNAQVRAGADTKYEIAAIYRSLGGLMILPLLQIGAIAGAAVCLYGFRAAMRRRNARSWDSLVARLRKDCSFRELGDQSVWNGELNTTPEEKWQLIHGAQGLWAMFENTSVMMEMADYAARNSDSVDPELLANLRSDALQIRVYVLAALGRYAFSQVNESISANVTHAAGMYTEMAARTSQLLQVNGGNMVPNFVAAM